MENKIKVYNRDNQNIWFERVNANTYIIKSDSEYALKYASINFDTVDNENASDFYFDTEDGRTYGQIHSFDPSGGPYISVGTYDINGQTVTRIYEKEIDGKNEMLFTVNIE